MSFSIYYKKNKKKKQIIISFFTLGIITLSILIKNLPTQLESESIKNYDFKIPISIIDAHRQFIWAFSIAFSSLYSPLPYCIKLSPSVSVIGLKS